MRSNNAETGSCGPVPARNMKIPEAWNCGQKLFEYAAHYPPFHDEFISPGFLSQPAFFLGTTDRSGISQVLNDDSVFILAKQIDSIKRTYQVGELKYAILYNLADRISLLLARLK